jgi:predicted ATP-dependent serine protease
MEKENLEKEQKIESKMCQNCGEEPVFMNGLCVYCYEEEFYENEDFEHKHKESKMNIHGQSLKDPHQQEISERRTISKISKLKR